MKRPRTLPGAELRATMFLENVEPPPERRDDGIGLPEITFAAGFLAAFVGVALVSVAAALVAAGALLAYLAWRFS